MEHKLSTRRFRSLWDLSRTQCARKLHCGSAHTHSKSKSALQIACVFRRSPGVECDGHIGAWTMLLPKEVQVAKLPPNGEASGAYAMTSGVQTQRLTHGRFESQDPCQKSLSKSHSLKAHSFRKAGLIRARGDALCNLCEFSSHKV